MAKRLTDTNKWEDEWFVELTIQQKLVWLYIVDKCDHAGFWKPSLKLLKFHCGIDNDLQTIIEWLGNRLVIIENGKWFIPSFLKFQYQNGLNSNKPAILGVVRLLQENNCMAIVRESLGNDFLSIKDIDIDKDIDKDKDIHVKEDNLTYNIKSKEGY